MNILYLAPRLPYPPNKGDKLRSYHQIEYLSRRHRVWCACFVDQPGDEQHVAKLMTLCADMAAIPLHRSQALLRGAASLALGGTVTEAWYRDPAMSAVLQNWSAQVRFDVVVAFSSGMASYALAFPAARRVLDLCDLDSLKWTAYARRALPPLRWLYSAEGRRLARRERRWLRAFDATTLISKAEAAPLSAEYAARKLFVIGNGVTLPDLDALRIRSQGLNDAHHVCDGLAVSGAHVGGTQTVTFVGVMDYPPNVEAVRWFVRSCWPRIRRACPGAVFRIVGRAPVGAVRRLARRAGVEVVGEVADVRLELARCDVSVAPLRTARGVQNKVLEAMAAARPVVVSAAAAEGISARPGRDFVVADPADAMVCAVVELLRDAVARVRLGRAARDFVASHHGWDDLLAGFEFVVTGMSSPVANARSLMPGAARAPEDSRREALSAGVSSH